MKISIYSNPPYVTSGYGQQMAHLIPKIAQDGHDLVVQPSSGNLLKLVWQGVTILPEGLVAHSKDVATNNIRKFHGRDLGFCLLLYDLWPLNTDDWKGINLACWTPVDHDPCPPKVAEFLLKGKHYTIAMSEFGHQRLKDAGVPKDELTYIPHAIDTTVFNDKGKSHRKKLGLPEDAFIVLTNAANRGYTPIRKGFGEMADAMALFMKDREDVYWILHTEVFGTQHGVNIYRLLSVSGVDMKRVVFPDPSQYHEGFSTDTLAKTYSASDCTLALSMGEGFGIPSSIESPACGTPAIVSDYTAQSEFITKHGKLVKVQRNWDEYQQAWFCVANIEHAYQCLQELYEETKAGKVDRQAISQEISKYDIKEVYERHWKPLIQTMGERLPPAHPFDGAVIQKTAKTQLLRTKHGLLQCPTNDQFIGQSLFYYGEYSEHELQLYQKIIKPGDVVVEVGSNIGAHTVPLGKSVGVDGKVMAFEPQPFIYSLLCANIGLNELSNVITYNMGLGSSEKTMYLDTTDYEQFGNFGGIGLISDKTNTPISVKSLDQFELAKCDFLKIDAEGMESDVLIGAKNTINKHKPIIAIENNYEEKSTHSIDILLEAGYDIYWFICPLDNKNNHFKYNFEFFNTQMMLYTRRKYGPEVLPIKAGTYMLIAFHKERNAKVTGLHKVNDNKSEHPFFEITEYTVEV